MPVGPRLHHLRIGREVAARIGVEGRADALEIALHRLVHALGEREVGDRVVHVEQRVSLGVDRCSLRARSPPAASR